jgi:chromosomal replication initiation ATPase DnaA
MNPLEFTDACRVFETAFSIPAGKITQRIRVRHISEPRFALMLFCKERLCMTGLRIAELLKLDHSAVFHGIKRARELRATDRFYQAKYTAAEMDFEKASQ